MIVNYNDRMYSVEFEHDTKAIRKTTTCKIFEIVDNKRLFCSYGISYCSVNDSFQYTQGRKKSLKKALLAFDSKDFRELVWIVYFTLHKDGKTFVKVEDTVLLTLLYDNDLMYQTICAISNSDVSEPVFNIVSECLDAIQS